MLLVLESLGPVERAGFVLREVFELPDAEIAAALGRTPDAVRQIAHRAGGTSRREGQVGRSQPVRRRHGAGGS